MSDRSDSRGVSAELFLVLAASNGVLFALVVYAFWETISCTTLRLFGLLFGWVSLSALVLGCGLVLVYVLWSLRQLRSRVKKLEKQKRRRPHLQYVPVLDENDTIVGYTREELAAPERVLPADVRQNAPDLDAQPSVSFRAKVASEIAPTDWDGWPNGNMTCSVDRSRLDVVANFALFWVVEKLSGRRPGDLEAQSASGGKVYGGQCRGALVCRGRSCPHRFVIAPGATLKDIARQLRQRCACGQLLEQRSCHATVSVVVFGSGAIFTHHESHTHPCYTHRLLTPAHAPPVFVKLTNDDWSSFLPELPETRIPKPPQLSPLLQLDPEILNDGREEHPKAANSSEKSREDDEWSQAEQQEVDDDRAADL
ncbi:hypothetical protein HMN09_01189200 [Mycena chlorophos]|uniref:Uncharacterized protein n=1 Tax=Mycena chlorophos TaxID=658473 RepID=A0A8H6S834_MYCCL|nr:hypothetical protein HMN09_01189200 [Mycena chlorophos]